jgi:hypothetical protein
MTLCQVTITPAPIRTTASERAAYKSDALLVAAVRGQDGGDFREVLQNEICELRDLHRRRLRTGSGFLLAVLSRLVRSGLTIGDAVKYRRPG